MTTRRGFLGLLAAAPLAAKGVSVEPARGGRFVSGVAGERVSELLTTDFVTLRFPPGAGPLLGAPPMIRIVEIDTARDFDVVLSAVPNRLLGAEINGRGEAV